MFDSGKRNPESHPSWLQTRGHLRNRPVTDKCSTTQLHE